MLIKLLAGVFAAASVTMLGFYVASAPQAASVGATALTASSEEGGPSCCATISRSSCCSVKAACCEVGAACCETEGVAAKSATTETLAACAGGMALAPAAPAAAN